MHDLKKLQRFHTSCLRKLLHIFWPEKISNNELFKLTGQEDMSVVLTRKPWSWVGHVLRREFTSISRVALRWIPLRGQKNKRPSKIHLDKNCSSRTSGSKPYLGASFTACKGPTGIETTCRRPMRHWALKD